MTNAARWLATLLTIYSAVADSEQPSSVGLLANWRPLPCVLEVSLRSI